MDKENIYIKKIEKLFENDSVVLRSFDVAKRNNNYNVKELFRRGKKARPKNKKILILEKEYYPEKNNNHIENDYKNIEEDNSPIINRYIATDQSEKIKKIKKLKNNNNELNKRLTDEWLKNNKITFIKSKNKLF